MRRFILIIMMISIASIAWAVDHNPHLILELNDDVAELARDAGSLPIAIEELALENTQLVPVFHLPNDPDKLAIFYDLGMQKYFRLIADNLDATRAYNEIEIGTEVENMDLVYPDIAHITPDDYYIYDMWGLTKMECPQAWDLHHGDSEVIVTTIDTGCTIDHEDLAANIRVNPGEDLNSNGIWDVSDNNGIDDDGNGFIDDLVGWDFVSHTPGSGVIPWEDYGPRDNLVYPDVHGHGTHVMGISAGVTNNDTGVAAASWNVKAMPLRAGYAWDYFGYVYGSGYSEDFADAVNYAVNNGTQVISISFGGSSYHSFYEDAVNYARANNVIIFASAGNSNNTTYVYPAAYDGALAVAATTQNDSKASFSTYGTWVAVSAPGVDIWSTMSNNSYHPYDYVAWDGTSMASPNAAAVAALLLSSNPTLTDDDLETIILATADNIDAANPGYIGQLGSGRVNAYNALQTNPMTLDITPINTTVGSGGGNITYSASLINNEGSTFTGLTYWTMVILPNGNDYGPAFTYVFNLNPYQNMYVPLIAQHVPGYAPMGTYTYICNVGFFPNVTVSDQFTFNKTGVVGSGDVDPSTWEVTGFNLPTELPVISSTAALPTEFSVEAAYPNPFNPTTSVSVNLPETATLNVTVYNVTGRQVAEMANGQFSAGSHTLNFDASNMASGLYFVRATVPGQLNATQKVMLVR